MLRFGPGLRAWAEEAGVRGGGREGREREGDGGREEAGSAGHGGDISQAVRVGQRELRGETLGQRDVVRRGDVDRRRRSSPVSAMGYLELLRTQPRFRRLWLGQVVSELGDWLQLIALLCLFPTSGRPVEALSGIFIVRMIPSIVWAPVAGVIADRFPRGRVMVACDLGRVAIVLS